MSAFGDTLRALDNAFRARAVEWYVFGAQAVALRGAPRATQDVDVTVSVRRNCIPALMEALESQDIRHRYPDMADELLAHGAVLPLVHRSGMEIDLVIAGSGLEVIALERATTIAVEGLDVPVAHATDLVVMKILAGRGKDLDDASALMATGEVDVDAARDLLTQLEEALGQSDLVPTLDEMLEGS